MNDFNLLLLSLIVWLNGCVSSSQRNTAIDTALTEIQAGQGEQGRAALAKMCGDGWSGPCALLGQPAQAHSPVSIMQSVTSALQSRFVILTPSQGKLTYYVRSDQRLVRVPAEFQTHSGVSGGIDQLEVFDLDPKTAYELIVIGPQAQLWDKRNFRALDTGKKRARIAVASCMDDRYSAEQAKIWPQLLEQKPDVILLIGDNVYIDRGAGTAGLMNADYIWLRNYQTRSSLAVFRANPLVPILAVWDDHDYGKNDGDRTFALKEESAKAFFAFFAQKKVAPGFETGPGVGSWWSAFGACTTQECPSFAS